MDCYENDGCEWCEDYPCDFCVDPDTPKDTPKPWKRRGK